MIIDAHIHPDPETDFADGGERLMAELAAAGINLAIASSVIGWGEFPEPAAVRTANDLLRRLVRRHSPRLQYLVYLNPQLPDWQEVLEEHRGAVIGIKLWISLKDAGGSAAHTEAVLRRAAEYGLPVLVHVFHRTDANRPGEIDLDEFCGLCRAVPACTMIGAHAGGNWREALGRLRHLPPNKYYDICGGYPERGMVEKLVESDGAERIVFGSDAVGRSYLSQLAKVRYARITPAEKEQILWRNAAEIFKLKKPLPAVPPVSGKRIPFPPMNEDHFCFCGRWPFADHAVSPAELSETLARYGVRRGYTVNMSDIFQENLVGRNYEFAAECAGYPNLAPLAVADPCRSEAAAQLESMSGPAGIWVSPYLHNYALDDPALAPFWNLCAGRKIKVWINTALSDWRFRSPSLAARQVGVAELKNFMRSAPENTYTIQGCPDYGMASAQWRFECSKLSDVERPRVPGERLVWGSEYPFRHYPQVYESLARQPLPDLKQKEHNHAEKTEIYAH